MLKVMGAALAGAAVLVCAGQAGAVTVTMSGVITGGSGSDGIIHVGDTLSFRAGIPDEDVLTVNASGLTGFGTYYNGFRGTPGAFLTVTLDGYTWTAGDDLEDGLFDAVCSASNRYQCEGGLGILLSGSHVVGLTGVDLSPESGPVPDLEISPDGAFVIANENYYRNTAVPQHYTGRFDLADAIVATGAPEPQTWGLMLVGFFSLGGLLRLRQANGSLTRARS